jgi:hypothetical protein
MTKDKVRGTVDGHPFRSSLMAMGDRTHELPIKAQRGVPIAFVCIRSASCAPARPSRSRSLP